MFVFIFLFGLLVGSFLNVIILRFDTGKGIGGRSGCFSCGNTLSWFELIPVFSFLFLKGKCRHCKSAISNQYPLVEMSTAIMFLAVYIIEPFRNTFSGIDLLLLLSSLVVWATLIVIFVYDLRHMVIPSELSIVFAITALLRVLLNVFNQGISVLYSSLLGALVLAGFLGCLWFFSKGAWMGFGDVEFAVGMGLYLGLPIGVSALAYSFWIGATIAISILLYKKIMGTSRLGGSNKQITMKSEIPFAPFLILGTAVAWYTQADLFHLSLLLSS